MTQLCLAKRQANPSPSWQKHRKKDAMLPVSGADIIAFPGVNAAQTAFNYAKGKAALTPVGAIVYRDGYAELTQGSRYIDTAYPETVEHTIIVVGRAVGVTGTGNQAWLMTTNGGTAGDPTDFGASLFVREAGVGLRASAGLQTAAAPPVSTNWLSGLTADPLTSWGFVYSRCRSTDLTVGNKTTGSMLIDATPADARVVSGRNWRAGGNYASSGTGRCDAAAIITFPFACSDDHIHALFLFTQKILAARKNAAGASIAITI
ncbi:hypothetical protein ACFQ4O_01730 [Methylopila musalis]|uniref:Uncharacterized protein n=1 Tax=Methylopila musalis TaxID=1134781 RepID=A0ABW3Z3F4_9HYPH